MDDHKTFKTFKCKHCQKTLLNTTDLDKHRCPIHLFWCPTLLKLYDFTEIYSIIHLDNTTDTNIDRVEIAMDIGGLDVTLA